jgi:hypothetical protein
VLLKVPGLLNYLPDLSLRDGRDCLSIQVHTTSGSGSEVLRDVEACLMRIPSVEKAAAQGRLLLGPVCRSPSDWPTTGTVKRVLVDRRPKGSSRGADPCGFLLDTSAVPE